jgi:multimeric flavodoxin WrbA
LFLDSYSGRHLALWATLTGGLFREGDRNRIGVMIQENVLEKRVVHTAQGDFTFTLFSGDLTHLYPGMVRYRVCVTDAMDRTVTEYFSNTFEYTPVMELDAKTAAINVLNEWERGFSRHPVDMLEYFSRLHPRCLPAAEATDVVVIQGSPRPDGNCGEIARWIATETARMGATVQVIYPDDMDIRSCIGCYQCYNSGFCTFADDMDEVFAMVQRCRVLAVCAPVYSCSVPGALKILIDRFLAYDAHRHVVEEVAGHQAGLFFGVCGRDGDANFIPLREIATAFFAMAGMPLTGTAWADGMDQRRDVRQVSGFTHEVQETVRRALEQTGSSEKE